MAEIIKTPEVVKAIRRSIVRAMKQSEPTLKSHAMANLSRVLRVRTGQLASSIYTKVTRGGTLWIGSPVFYARIWEKGRKGTGVWYRKAKGKAKGRSVGTPVAARPFLQPAAEQVMPQIAANIDAELSKELEKAIGTINIELKIM